MKLNGFELNEMEWNDFRMKSIERVSNLSRPGCFYQYAKTSINQTKKTNLWQQRSMPSLQLDDKRDTI